MHVPITWKYKKKIRLNILTNLKWIRWIANEKKGQHQFFRGSRAAYSVIRGWIWPNFKLIQALMYVIVTCMKRIWWRTAEEKWQHRFSHYKAMGIFSDAQGQLTPQTVVGSGRISKFRELSCMSSLPASMKRIRWKTAENKSAAGMHDTPPWKIIRIWLQRISYWHS